MREAVICEPVRTAVGRYGGALRDVPAHELAAAALRGLIERTGLTSEDVDDVLLGQCYPNPDAPAIGRVAALDAGLEVSVTGMQLDRRCGSGLQAVLNAAMQVQTGVSDLVIAGGAESMSSAMFYSTSMRWGAAGEGVMLHDGLARGRVTAGGLGSDQRQRLGHFPWSPGRRHRLPDPHHDAARAGPPRWQVRA